MDLPETLRAASWPPQGRQSSGSGHRPDFFKQPVAVTAVTDVCPAGVLPVHVVLI